MSDLFITEQGCSIHKSGESLLLKKDGKQFFEIELKNVDTIQIFGNVQFSTQVAQDMMKRGIEFAFYTTSGELLGQLTPPHIKNIELRYKQYQLANDIVFRIEFSKYIISLKFENSISLLKEALRKRSDSMKVEDIHELEMYYEKLKFADSISTLMGLEGMFAKKYFSLYGLLFKEHGIFNGRSKRPPKDPGNACLSFVYTLLTNRISSYIDGIGFDPYLGFLHSIEYGRVSLACDMIEPFRSIFCDRFTLSLFNLKVLSASDFEAQDDGIFFTHEAKKKFFSHYAEELLKTKSYSLIQGNFQALLNVMVIWMKNCISEGKVIPIEVPK